MTHADPWDEIARLEKQMDVDLLAQIEEAPPRVSRTGVVADKDPVGAQEPEA